jgi:CRISPR-associated protein Cas5d
MNESIYLRTWGELACFTRPEMKVERVSYSVMTPSAARGLLEAILYKPQFRWRVHRIAVKKPIRFLALKRNEVKDTISETQLKAAANGDAVEVIFADEMSKNKGRTQRNTLALRDVEYIIEASLELTSLANQRRRKPPCEDEPAGDDNRGKYYGMFRRRAGDGQCFARPCLGCREFPANFELADESAMRVSPETNPDTDLGMMLYDVFDLDLMHEPGRVDIKPKVSFFSARLERGVMGVPDWAEVKKRLGGAA